ncbi:hypothetical protein BLA60_30035 [Actinophytocola xinjiangensis]|uniref:ABC-2 type transport system permease protein n=1 Tax=Actinophytocola xinjiangensis TaxID=485602 RepID=A0A7Z0WGN3_9PSEU|nr:hypothetical protein [Actinophytocola xinjiangensis]OLF06793.1 hypothetical protein BLA60_30035 [Actinophytocola xinjiangensis]
MRPALHAEWTKIRTVAAPWWLLLAALAVITAGRLTGHSLTGAALSQAPLAILAVRTITDEYRAGLILTTFTATPRRGRVLAAKATVVAGLVAATGALGVFPAAPHLTLTALLGLGIAAVVRDPATSIGLLLALLHLIPLLAQAIADPYWHQLLLSTTPGLGLNPDTPWGGLGTTAAWTAAALGVATATLHRRDG